MKIQQIIYKGAAAAVAALTLAACGSDNEPAAPAGGQPREVTIIASLDDAPGSRTGIDYNSPDGKTGMFWMPGDVVGAVSLNNGAYEQAQMTNPGQAVQQRQVGFTGTVRGELKAAYYPYNATGFNNGRVTLPIENHQMWSNATSIAKNDIKAARQGATGWETDGTIVHAKFQNLGVLLLVRITNPSASMTTYERLRSVKMTVPGSAMTGNYSIDLTTSGPLALTAVGNGGNQDNLTIEWDYVPLISAHPWGYCVIAPTDLTGKTVQFEVISIYDEHTSPIPTRTTNVSLTGGQNLQAGRVYTIDLDLSNS